MGAKIRACPDVCRISLAGSPAQELRVQTVSRETSLLKHWDYTQTYQHLHTSKTYTCPEASFASGMHNDAPWQVSVTALQ